MYFVLFALLSDGLLNFAFNRQLLLISFLVLKSLTIFLVPQWTQVKQFYFNGFFNGFFTAAIIVMVNVWLNEIWCLSARRRRLELSKRLTNGSINGQNVIEVSQLSHFDIGNVAMQALHFFFGIGSFLGPLLAEPFLRAPFIEHKGFFSNCLVAPYAISSLVSFTAALIFFFLFIFCPYTQVKRSQCDSEENLLLESNDERLQNPNYNRTQYYVLVLCSALFMLVFVSSEGSYFQFSASFVTKTGLHLNQSQAALLASSIAISFTIFRGLSILIALKLTPRTMIVLDLITVAVGNAIVYLFANTNYYLTLVGFIFLGAGFSSVFPSFFPFLENSGLKITDWVGSLLTFAGGITQTLSPYLIGIYIDTWPYIIVYFTFASITLSITVLGALCTLIYYLRK